MSYVHHRRQARGLRHGWLLGCCSWLRGLSKRYWKRRYNFSRKREVGTCLISTWCIIYISFEQNQRYRLENTDHAELEDMPELTLFIRLWPVLGSGERTVSLYFASCFPIELAIARDK